MNKLSIIIPVYNRPQEVKELFQSLTEQTCKDFEVIVVEDGSEIACDSICESYRNRLNLKYFFKENSGPGQSRNYGCQQAGGTYFIFLDSDCILPLKYVEIVQNALTNNPVDAFGGPDSAHPDFSILQKAINYSMTSFFTTGGIRGKSEKMDKFYPRSFNMGFSKTVFETTQGFSKMRFGEDIDMSIRILKSGFKTKLFKDAFVYHKRRSTVKQFYKQVFNSGIARINLYTKHPDSLKWVHWLPAVFTSGVITILLLSIFVSAYFLFFIAFHVLLIWMDATLRNKNMAVGFFAVMTTYFQLTGYGLGFILAVWHLLIRGKEEFTAFNKTFYR
jgi:glycosyltransferase involved in cell wall biosynthesis